MTRKFDQGYRAFIGWFGLLLLLGSGCGVEPALWETGSATPQLTPEEEAALPEIPAIDRDISLFDATTRTFTRPHIPPFRTTQDGRLSFGMATGNKTFQLLRPEELTKHFWDSANPTEIMSGFAWPVAPTTLHASTLPAAQIGMTTVCDPTPEIPSPAAPATRNPYPCGTTGISECYDITIISVVMSNPGTPEGKVELWGKPMKVEVVLPKTKDAFIISVTSNGPLQKSPVFDFLNMFEPMVDETGRFLGARISHTPLEYQDANGVHHSGFYDTVYSAYAETEAPCDVTKWDQFFPITHIPYDPQMQRFGIAAYPFRDPEGNLIPDGADFKGTYPWFDRKLRNMFVTTLSERFHYVDPNGVTQTRFPAACLPGVSCNLSPTEAQINDADFEGGWHYQGLAVAGLWTHGKLVSVDGRLAHIDFNLKSAPEKQRMMKLYQENTGPAHVQDQSGWQVGAYGRPSFAQMPLEGARNGEFIDSVESLLAFSEHLRPKSPRDVVWLMSTGKATDEVEFDDWLDLDALIVSNMRASLTHENPGYANNSYFMRYRDGFRYTGHRSRGVGYVDEVRLQNGATSPNFNLPSYGLVEGNARIEPLALGGIKGKGLWLDGQSLVRYRIPKQQLPLEDRDWYISLFVDQRQPGDVRVLYRFPDGGLVLTIQSQVIGYFSAAGRLYFNYLPAEVAQSQKQWQHYAIGLRNGGKTVDFYLNGMLFWTVEDTLPILSIIADDMTLGGGANPFGLPGARGWLDDFKVIGRTPSAELACNHARGYLVGVEPGSPYWKLASSYPADSHKAISDVLSYWGKPTSPKYYCVHNYQHDDGLPLNLQATADRRVSQDLHFPEGPLIWHQPRPNSRNNTFCTTCHQQDMPGGLGLDALDQVAAPLYLDARRQPSMWPILQSGMIPADFVAPGVPASPIALPLGGLQVYDFILQN